MLLRRFALSCLMVAAATSTVLAAKPGLKSGPVSIQSIGPMAFAPDGVLLVGDPKDAAVYAIDTQDKEVAGSGTLQIANIEKAIASALEMDKVQIGELAVNPETGNVFLSVVADGKVHLSCVTQAGEIAMVGMENVGHAKKALPSPPADNTVSRRGRSRNPRDQSITDLAFFEGKVIVSGMSATDSPSRVLEFPFPFADNSVATSVEIFHAAHGRVEEATIQTFLPLTIDGKPSLLAGFTCTPLVRFSLDELDGSDKVRGTTVAELGNRNKPLDMVVYEKDGVTSILMSNTARGVMKISTDGIDERETLTDRVSGGGTAGQPFETIASLANVKQMDKLDNAHAIALIDNDGSLDLDTILLP